MNSAGKSAVILSILSVLKKADADGSFLLKQFDFSFKSAVCRYNAYDDYRVTLETDDGNCILTVNAKNETLEPRNFALRLEKSVFYLNANRKGYGYARRVEHAWQSRDFWLKEFFEMKFNVNTVYHRHL